MTSGKTIDTDRLEACIRKHLPGAKGPVTLSPIPTGKFNDSFFADTDAGEYVLRIAPSNDTVFLFYEREMMRQEPGIHAMLLERTQVPVAPVVAFDDSQDILSRNFILMERLPGRPLSEVPTGTGAVLETVGKWLRQTHDITASSGRYGYLGEHAPMEPQPTWAQAFRVMWGKLLDDIVGAGVYDEEEREALIGLLETHLELFDRDVPASLLHMDVWGQNILVDSQGRASGLVDWDRALWGDPEIEFAVLDYCGISQPAFWRGYGSPRDESPEAQVRNVFYLLYELQKYIVIRQGRNGDRESALGYKSQTRQIVERCFGAQAGTSKGCVPWK